MSFVHYYAGNALNRLSWLRKDVKYLNAAVRSKQARYILLNELSPLCTEEPNAKAAKLFPVSFDLVKEYLSNSDQPFFLPEESVIPLHVDHADGITSHPEPFLVEIEDAKPALVFLGVDESTSSNASLPEYKHLADADDSTRMPTGETFFALDASNLQSLRNAAIEEANKSSAGTKASFLDLRAGVSRLSASESGIAAEARALIDWNKRNRFCAGCGQATGSVWGGWKRMCRPTKDAKGAPCISKKGIHNFQYPRTDPVCIMAILHPTEDKILLGRNKNWPKGFMSCLAGFIESGESLEEAVQREVFEESGVRVRNVKYHSSQPWPYPSSLMIGCTATAEENQEIRTDLDNELEQAVYVSKEFVLDALKSRAGITRQEVQKFDQEAEAHHKKDELRPEEIRLPPNSAIAHVLISEWAQGRVSR